MKKLYVFTKCFLILITTFYFTASPVCNADEKGMLVIGMKDNSVSLDPAESYEISGYAIGYQVYNTLVDFKEGDYTQFVPELAEAWELGEDGKTWTFYLRKGITFASGNPVNADAVVFSLRRPIKLEKKPVWLLTQFGISEESITKVDEHTVQIVLDQQYAPSLFLSCLTVLTASILDPKVVKEHEQDDDMGSAWLHNHSAGSGPYMIVERRQNEYVVLQANDEYWGEKPVFDRVILRNIPDSLEQTTLLEQGKIDIAWDLSPDQSQVLVRKPGLQVLETLTFSIYYLGMNLGYKPFKELDVRNAIRFAIDYDGLINIILQGAAVKIQTFIPKGILGHNPALPYNYDLDKAKQLLADAGYPNGFEVELNCFDWSPWVDVAMKIKADLAATDIRVNVKPLPRSQLLQAYRAREYQMTLIRWLFDYTDPDGNAKSFAHSDSLGNDATLKLNAWLSKYVNRETSKMVEQAVKELDQEKRETLYEQMSDIIRDEGPFVFLYTPLHQYGLRSEIAEILNPDSVSLYKLPIP